MFSKIAILSTVAFAIFATAAPLPGDGNNNDQCGTGQIHCCNSVQDACAPGVTALLGLLNIDVSSVKGLVGLTCSPLSAAAIGGNSCSAQTACCKDNSFNGVVALGCTPIKGNL